MMILRAVNGRLWTWDEMRGELIHFEIPMGAEELAANQKWLLGNETLESHVSDTSGRMT